MTETVEHVDYVDYDSYAAKMMAWPILLKKVAKWPAILCPPAVIVMLAAVLTQQTMIDYINGVLTKARMEYASSYIYSDVPVVLRSDPGIFMWLSGPWTTEASLPTAAIIGYFAVYFCGIIGVCATLWCIAVVIGKSFGKDLGGFLKLEGLCVVVGAAFFVGILMYMFANMALPYDFQN